MKQSTLSIYAEDTLKNFGIFLEEHDKNMKILSTQLITSSTATMTPIAPAIEIKYVDAEVVPVKHMEMELVINKSLSTIAHLCNECQDLTKSIELFQLKFLLADAKIEKCHANVANDGILHRMSETVDFLCQVYFLMKRVVIILQNLFHQMTVSMSMSADFNEFHVLSVFNIITELLEQVMVFDEIAERSMLNFNWIFYKKYLQSLSKNTDTSGKYTKLELNGVNTSLKDIEIIISGNIFRTFLDGLVELKKNLSLKDINNITQNSNAFIKQQISNIESSQSNEYKHVEEPKHVMRITAFICILYSLGIQIEAKLMKNLVDNLSKYHHIALYKNINWSPHTFLVKYTKSFIKLNEKVKPYNIGIEKFNLCDQKSCRQLCTKITLWAISMQRAVSSDVIEHLKHFSNLIILGHKYTDHVNFLIESIINRHFTMTAPISQGTLVIICKLFQYLKILQQSFASNHFAFIRFLNEIIQWQKQKILHTLLVTKKKILDVKQLQHKMNILSTLKLAERAIKGFHIKRRLTIINIAFNEFLEKERQLPQDKLKYLKSILMRSNNLIKFQKNILAQFDHTHLIFNYWSLSSSRAKEFAEQQSKNIYSLHNLVTATNQLDKTVNVFDQCRHNSIIFDVLSESLCLNLEMFLRVEALSHLFLEQSQPFSQDSIDFRNLISEIPVEVNGNYNILKDKLENYFTATFYNLTTIAPQDWKSYEKMRHFSSKLFGLKPVDDYLPNQIIDQGIDVLQIMRNIHTFASSYSYNMNLQLFVENQSRTKYLDIIGTRHIANSVQTHGTGIINTTVNFIYQFLRQKFYTFSTFLHDEHIKSRLLGEYRYYAEQKHSKIVHSYSYERAESFLKKIRTLGVSNIGETYMDLFRKVITQVGNAVGYVRLLQSGSKNANYRSRSYMCTSNSNYVRCTDKALHEVTEDSIREYEKSIGFMKESYSDCTNYFKLLMQGFQPFLCNPHNHHLKTFFLITPSLIMNYIDYRVREKLKIYKKDQPKCSLFEDGFAIGLIYILNMLNQLGEFHELAWQSTVFQQLNAERLKAKDLTLNPEGTNSPVKADENEKLIQTVAITERHITSYENEYNLLYASLSSAEIFFQ